MVESIKALKQHHTYVIWVLRGNLFCYSAS